MTSKPNFVWESVLPYPVEDVFAWHAGPGALERLNPSWRPVTVASRSGNITNGSRVSIKLPVGPIKVPLLIEHRDYIENVQFCDYQLKGPFASWKHVHTFNSISESSSNVRDEIVFQLPLAMRHGKGLFMRELERVFRYRHAILAADLRAHSRWAREPRQHILVSGSSGFIGQALCAYLTTAGHQVTRLVRREPANIDERRWNPDDGTIDADAFIGVGAVIHLGGDNVASGVWTDDKKRRIRESRVASTTLLARSLAASAKPPHAFIVASGIGYYGDVPEGVVDETAPCGSGFLAGVCREWEDATSAARDAGIRTVNLRIGAVLNPRSGILQKLLPIFRFALGGVLGDGKQGFSWIAQQDLLGLIEEAIFNRTLRGPVNCVAPNPVSNAEFTRTLAQVVKRPAVLPAPRKVIEIAAGDMGREVLLSGVRALPSRALQSGYEFQLPTLEQALRFECGLPG